MVVVLARRLSDPHRARAQSARRTVLVIVIDRLSHSVSLHRLRQIAGLTD